MASHTAFSAADLELLTAVLSLNDSMNAAAYGVRLVEELLNYPISSIHEVRRVFDRIGNQDGAVKVGPCLVTFEEAQRYLTSEMFPIENRDELISRLVHAFEKQRFEVLDAIADEQSRRPLGRQAPAV